MKTIKATMPCQANKNSWAELLSANISNDDKVVKDFVRHPLFKDFFIREAGVFAPETECYRFRDDVRGWLEVEDVLDILEDVQRIYGEEA